MPSSPYPARRKVDKDLELDDDRVRKRIEKFDEDVKPVVDREEIDDRKRGGEKVRRAGVRSSSRIATLASRTPVKQESPDLSPSPQRVRKKVKVTVKETKVSKKVKVEKKVVKKEAAAPVKSESDVNPQSDDVDDLGEVAEEVNHGGMDQLGLKLQQQLAGIAGLSDAMQVKATIRIFNFLYLEAIQVCVTVSHRYSQVFFTLYLTDLNKLLRWHEIHYPILHRSIPIQ